MEVVPAAVLLKQLRSWRPGVPLEAMPLVPVPVCSGDRTGDIAVLLATQGEGAKPYGHLEVGSDGEVQSYGAPALSSVRTPSGASAVPAINASTPDAAIAARNRYLSLVDKLRSSGCNWGALDEREWSQLRADFAALTPPTHWPYYKALNSEFFDRLGLEPR